MKDQSKMFFFLSFIPAMAYWFLEENYSIRIAALGGVGLAVIEIILEKLIIKKVHKISVFNFVLIVFLGSLSFIGDDGIWFKLQPCLTGLTMGGAMTYFSYKGKGLVFEFAQEMGMNQGPIQAFVLPLMEKHLAYFMVGYGAFMGGVSFMATTSTWLFFKTVGFYISAFVFFLIEMVFIRTRVIKTFGS